MVVNAVPTCSCIADGDESDPGVRAVDRLTLCADAGADCLYRSGAMIGYVAALDFELPLCQRGSRRLIQDDPASFGRWVWVVDQFRRSSRRRWPERAQDPRSLGLTSPHVAKSRQSQASDGYRRRCCWAAPGWSRRRQPCGADGPVRLKHRWGRASAASRARVEAGRIGRCGQGTIEYALRITCSTASMTAQAPSPGRATPGRRPPFDVATTARPPRGAAAGVVPPPRGRSSRRGAGPSRASRPARVPSRPPGEPAVECGGQHRLGVFAGLVVQIRGVNQAGGVDLAVHRSSTPAVGSGATARSAGSDLRRLVDVGVDHHAGDRVTAGDRMVGSRITGSPLGGTWIGAAVAPSTAAAGAGSR